MAKFVIYKDKKDEYRFRLVASNGEKMLASEGYTSKAGCENGVESVRKNSQDMDRFEEKEAKNGKWMFNLKAGNGQVIGSSQQYASQDSMENGRNWVHTKAAWAALEEEED